MLVASLQDLFEVGAIGFDYVERTLKPSPLQKQMRGPTVTYYSVEQRNPVYCKELLATARGQRRRNS